MDDFFGKEITPFAKVITNEKGIERGTTGQIHDMDPDKMNMTLKDRWKFIDSGTDRGFFSLFNIINSL